MNNKNRLVVVDIGSHKLEELSVLLGPFRRQYGVFLKWTIKKVLKAVLKADFSFLFRIRCQIAVIKYFFLAHRSYNLQVISIEPNIGVAYPFVEQLSRKYPVHYIPAAVLGHDAQKESELKTLFFYDKSLSSSIYKKDRPINNEKGRVCVGVKFDLLWDGLVKEGIINSDDPFLLRMNCEGAELGVIEGCLHKGLKPLCIIGSLGDVDKIHGRQAGDKTRKMMDDMGTPYFYFKGDDPSTWYDMIPIWEKYTSIFKKTL